MNKVMLLIIYGFPFLSHAQGDTAKGIKWTEGLSWEQVKQKAKKENKYIFVDCFATWCKPCKEMDESVYPLDTVGKYFNENFVSVKVQMDSSKKDDEFTKRWYEDAHLIKEEFSVSVFPSYLFFSPDDQIAHKSIGAKGVNEFIELANIALDTNRQYYTLLNKYQAGNKSYEQLVYLSNVARDIGEKQIASQIAQDYIDNYLLFQNEWKLYTKQSIDFLTTFINSTKDKSFLLFYKQANKIDSVVGRKGFAQSVADYVITKEEITPIVKVASEGGPAPNWKKMEGNIKGKYGIDYAGRTIIKAKLRWYYFKQDWKMYNKTIIKKVQEYGIDTTDAMGDFYLNAMVWDGIFLHGNNKKQIKTAIKWMEGVLSRHPTNNAFYQDTYANLLYKIGKKTEAIAIEERVVEMETNSNSKKEYMETLEKMRNNKPTWEKE